MRYFEVRYLVYYQLTMYANNEMQTTLYGPFTETEVLSQTVHLHAAERFQGPYLTNFQYKQRGANQGQTNFIELFSS